MSATDLDAFIPPDKTVTFRGRRYVLPGDLPMETYLKLALLGELQDTGGEIAEVLEHTITVLTDLFTDEIEGDVEKAEARVRLQGVWEEDPDTDEPGHFVGGEFRRLGLGTIMQLVQRIYPPPEQDESEVDADAAPEDPPTPEDGTTSTTSSPSATETPESAS